MKVCTDNKSTGTTYGGVRPGQVFTFTSDGKYPKIKIANGGYLYLHNGAYSGESEHSKDVIIYPDACVCLDGEAGQGS